jgi:hypothetical protein
MATLLIVTSIAFSEGFGDSFNTDMDLEEDTSRSNTEMSLEENIGRSKGITNGQIDHGHPAVGIVNYGCTGTLIGLNTVLTAAHCVDDSDTATFIVGGEKYYGTATGHPAYYHHNYEVDLALITLDHAVQGIEPLPLCKTVVGLKQLGVTIVGFGRSKFDVRDFGTKRWARNDIDRSSRNVIYSSWGSQICYGDSGGPALLDATYNSPECVIGVASVTWSKCTTMGHTRPDGLSDWIDRSSVDRIQWVTPCGRKCQRSNNDYNDYYTCELACSRKCEITDTTDRCGWVPSKPKERRPSDYSQ